MPAPTATIRPTNTPQPTKTPVPTATPYPDCQSSHWHQVWSDEFNYSGLPDSQKWAYEVGYIRNQELQYYTKIGTKMPARRTAI